jgi:chromosome segregation protein
VLPEADGGLEEALDDAERRLADLLRDAEQLREAGRADQQRAAVARAARERLLSDADRAARRASESQRRAQAQEASTLAAREAAAQATERAAALAEAREVAHRAEEAAENAASQARMAAGQAAAAAAAAAEAAARLGAELEGLTARRESLEQELRDGTDERLMRSLRAKGGRRFSDGLEVEPSLRIAVESALGDVLAGLVLDADDAHALSEAAAVLILRDVTGAQGRPAERAVARLEEGVLAAGGGWLSDGLRLDPEGQAARLLARCAWVPDLASALSLRGQLPPGWRLVTRDGVVLDDLAVVRPAPAVSKLERREVRDEIVRRMERLQPELDAARAAADGAERAREQADAQVATARDALDEARRARRLADEADRSAASAAENAGRERAWQEAMLERARSDAGTAARESASRDQEVAQLDAGRTGDDPTLVDQDALKSLEARVGVLRSERDQLATMVSEGRAVRERALEERRRAEVGLGLAEARQLELDQEAENLGSREASLTGERERAAAALASAVALQQQASDAYAASVASARAEREELLAAEAAAGRAREQLRVAEQRSRASEVAEMEARLQVDAAREGLLVELASIGPDGLAALSAADARSTPLATPPAEELPELLEAALDAAVARWNAAASDRSEEDHHVTAAGGAPATSVTPSAERPVDGPTPAAMPAEPPSRARLAALRRRFNEVGAGNPFAAQELAEVTTRLESLEAQRDDLERAIRDTRELMARLDELMAMQFRETFEALEGAFARRFHQLFGGGDAQLSLTDPADLASTGVEITARPPGKRRQPLAMLSGGERALTAVSLLMAMLEVRPVPFCVLDEVDAALDEANIGRFSSALRSLAEEIQFVVITHNRGTIEAADALYGVTVGDDAISHVVSLRLEASSEPQRAASGALA